MSSQDIMESTTAILSTQGCRDMAEDVPTPRYQYPEGFSEALGFVLVMENIVGLLFNVTVLVVHMTRKETIKTTGSLLLINLNIVDVLVCALTIPMTTARVFTGFDQSALFCGFHEASVSMATTSTALGLMLVSVDRYHTIVTPFKRRLNRSNIPVVIGLMWVLVAFGYLFPIIALSPKSLSDKEGNATMSCFLWVHYNNARLFHELYYVLVYLLAVVVMIGCYTSIYIAAKRRINTRISIIRAAVSSLPGGPRLNINAQKLHERTITKMTLMIVLTFVVCWAPHVIVSAVMVAMDTQYMELVQVVCLVLAYTGTLLHPLLYAFMQKNFRDMFNQKVIPRTTPKVGNSANNSAPGRQQHRHVPKVTPDPRNMDPGGIRVQRQSEEFDIQFPNR